MTNIDLIGFIKKRIGKYIDDRKKSLKESEKYFDSKSKHIDALNCQFRKNEDEIIKLGIEDEIDKLIEFLNLDTEDSTYKEMWKELKEKIGERIEDYHMNMSGKPFYLYSINEIKHEEADNILHEMNNIEYDRGVE